MSKGNERSDYGVGYGKPPVEHRFKKGQSGNPKGRPRKPKQKPEPEKFRDGRLDSILEEEAFRTLFLQENGKPVEMSALRAISRSLLLDGVKGNRLAKKQAYQLLREEERKTIDRLIDRYKHYSQTKAEGQAEIERCRKQGLPPPRLFPHPDDILLDEAKVEVHILGPETEDQTIPHERGAMIRDWFLAAWVFQDKCGEETMFEIEDKAAPAGGVFATMVNDALPPSYRRDEGSLISIMMELRRLTKRQLRQRMRELMTQIAEFPETIEEQLAARKRSVQAMSAISEGFEKAAIEIAERQEGS